MRGLNEVVVTSDGSGQICSAAVWDPSTGTTLSAYKNAGALRHHTVNVLNNSYLLAADSNKPRLYLWPLNKQAPVQNLRLVVPGNVSAMSCTPDGLYVVAAVGEKLCVWQLSTGDLLAVIMRHYQTITCIKFTGDGSTFVSGAEDGLVFVWSLSQVVSKMAGHTASQRTTPLYSFSDHSLAVKDISVGQFGPQARLISVSLDCTAKIYDLNNGLLLLSLVYDVPLTSVCLDILESNLFIGSSNGNIIQFDLHSPPRGTEYHVEHIDKSMIFQGHSKSITCLSVSNDCNTLLSGSADASVNVWHIPSRQVIRSLPHKGPITAAFFTKYVSNYHTNDLKPKLQIHSLQRSSEDHEDDFIEITSNHSEARLLDVDSYFQTEKDYDPVSSSSSHSQMSAAQEEIRRLKTVNAAIYQLGIRYLSKPELN